MLGVWPDKHYAVLGFVWMIVLILNRIVSKSWRDIPSDRFGQGKTIVIGIHLSGLLHVFRFIFHDGHHATGTLEQNF